MDQLSTEDRALLGALCTRDEAGIHFTQRYDLDWLHRMEQDGYVIITCPIHEATGIRYSPEYWDVEPTAQGLAIFEGAD